MGLKVHVVFQLSDFMYLGHIFAVIDFISSHVAVRN